MRPSLVRRLVAIAVALGLLGSLAIASPVLAATTARRRRS